MGRFGVAAKAAIFKADRLLVLYKTALEAEEGPDPTLLRDLPGGRIEFGEAPEDALKREIREEVSLTVTIVAPVHIWHFVKRDFQLIGVTYVCDWVAGEVVLGSEHDRFEWLSRDEIQAKNWRNTEEYWAAFDHRTLRAGHSM